MPAMISPENQEVIARELAARDVDHYTIEWGLDKIDRAARRFVDGKSRPSQRIYSPHTLAKQVQKVQSLSGAAQDRAVLIAKKMGLDSEAIDVLARPRRSKTLVEHARDQQILMRLTPQFNPDSRDDIAKRTCLVTDAFQVTCIGVWLATGGEVRFSINNKNDGGPFGRFLTAAFFDAYSVAGVRMTTIDSIRKKITRLKASVEAKGFNWEANFSPEIETDVENLDQFDLIADYYDVDD